MQKKKNARLMQHLFLLCVIVVSDIWIGKQEQTKMTLNSCVLPPEAR